MNSKLKDDLIARYAIYLAAKKMAIEVPDNKLTDNERILVAKEISDNPELSEYIDFLQTSYREFYQKMDKSNFGNVTLTSQRATRSKFASRVSYPLVRYSFVAATILLLIFFSSIFIYRLSIPSYYSIIDEALDIKLSITRSEPASSLSMGKAYFNQSKYLEAITQFKGSYQESSRDSTQKALFAYFLGITYLENSSQSILGLFPGYQPSQLDSSFKYLEISKLGLDNFPPLRKDLDWYRGIVESLRYSINGNEIHYTNAVRYLNKVVGQKTERSEMARTLLDEIKK